MNLFVNELPAQTQNKDGVLQFRFEVLLAERRENTPQVPSSVQPIQPRPANNDNDFENDDDIPFWKQKPLEKNPEGKWCFTSFYLLPPKFLFFYANLGIHKNRLIVFALSHCSKKHLRQEVYHLLCTKAQ